MPLRMGAEIFHHLKAVLKARVEHFRGRRGRAFCTETWRPTKDALAAIAEAVGQAGYTLVTTLRSRWIARPRGSTRTATMIWLAEGQVFDATGFGRLIWRA